MSLRNAFGRLTIESSSNCHRCRRTIVTTAQRQQQQSATGSFADMLSSSRESTNTMARRTASTETSSRTAALPSDRSSPAPPPSEPPQTRDSMALARQAIREANASRLEAQKRQQELALQRGWDRRDLEGQVWRKWKLGDIYAPHDLSGVEQAKWKKMRQRPRPKYDVIDQLGLNPLKLYKNFSIMSEYISDMGRIRHGTMTGLRPVNQRKMAKAIRRSMGMGLMPGVHRHPEIIKKELEARRSTY